ncbi:MAG: DUF3122 domain-containing protein [Thainema sp.]
MWHQLQRTVSLLVVTALVGLTLLCCIFSTPPALAAIRQLEEAPGQVVYQSRQTLKDQHNNSWQAIAFKRIQPDANPQVYLRLVGFPGTADIDRSQPLVLTSSMGQTLEAADASSRIFTDASAPEPNVGQYNLQPILAELRAELPWRLQIPAAEGVKVTLPVPSSIIQEWQTVAQYD